MLEGYLAFARGDAGEPAIAIDMRDFLDDIRADSERGGMTALLDAQGRTIVELGRELAAMPEDERPGKVLVLTITDGQENASKHFNLQQVGALIQQQRDVYQWQFVYMGANQDAVATAAAMNIPAGSAMTFSPSPMAMQGTMRAAGAMVSRGRTGQAASFTDEERRAALEGDARDA